MNTDDGIDLVSDLKDGVEPSVADAAPLNGGPDTQQVAPPGTQPAHGDAKQVNTVEQPTTDKPVTLRDQLSTAFKGTEGEPVDQAAAQSVQAPALTQDAEGKWHTADGLFASIEQIKAFEQSQQANTAAPVIESQVLGGFTPAEQQQFQSLPAELQQFVGRTMEGLNTRAARLGEYENIEQSILGPRREAFAREGYQSPAQALGQLFAISDFAGTKPADFILWFAEQQKIDLDQLLDERDAQAQNPVDPVVAQLRNQVQQLEGFVQNTTQNQAQQAHDARLATTQDFCMEKDESGALKRPYLTEVSDEWARQVQLLRTTNPLMPDVDVLQKAYDNACWTNPNVRTSMQQAAANAQKQQNGQRVAQAVAAGSSITGGPAISASTAPNSSARTLREEIQANLAASTA